MRSEVAQVIRQDQVMELVYGNSSNPKQLLGRHLVRNGQVISTYHPDAIKVTLIDSDGRRCEMEQIERVPIFAIYLPHQNLMDYRLEFLFRDGNTFITEDPYSFDNIIKDEEEKKFISGTWTNCYQKLGAHPMTIRGVKGVHFAVWAPHARRVSLVGDFNFWNGMLYPMQKHESSGIFELFIPKIGVKEVYKFEIKTYDGKILQRIDPFGTTDLEQNSKKANSIVIDRKEDYLWKDQQWMKDRRFKNWKELPMAMCDEDFLDVPEEGARGEKTAFTHVLLNAPDFTHGLRGNVREWIDQLHQNGTGVILSVPLGAFTSEHNGLKNYDGSPVYGHTDERLAYDHKKKVYRFDHGKPEVRSYLLSYLTFWIREYHIDGFLFDSMSDIVNPTYSEKDENGKRITKTLHLDETREFFCQAAEVIKNEDSSILVIADERDEMRNQNEDLIYAKAPFDTLIDYSVPHNYVEYVSTGMENPERKFYRLSLPLMKNGLSSSITDIALRPRYQKKILNFAQNKLNEHERMSWGRLSMGYLMGVPGKKRWSGARVQSSVIDLYLHELFGIYSSHSCMYNQNSKKSSFQWINGMNAKEAVLNFVRCSEGKEKNLMFVCNFSRNRKESYNIGVPKYTDYRLLLNSDWQKFGGASKEDVISFPAVAKEWDLQPYSLRITIPPLSVLIFEY